MYSVPKLLNSVVCINIPKMLYILNLQVIILTVEVCNIITDLTKHVVKDYEGIENLMDEGNTNR